MPNTRPSPPHTYSTVRPDQPWYKSALSYVYKNWSDAYAHSPWRGMVCDQQYREVYKPIVEQSMRAVESLGGLVLCHHPDESLQEFYGWAAVEPTANCVHMAYVTKIYRGHGFMRGCLAYAGLPSLDNLIYSWRTTTANELARKYRWKYKAQFGRALQVRSL